MFLQKKKLLRIVWNVCLLCNYNSVPDGSPDLARLNQVSETSPNHICVFSATSCFYFADDGFQT